MIFEFVAAASLMVGAQAAQAAQPREVPAARVRAAEKALNRLDLGRVLSDRPYAEATLRNLDVLLAAPDIEPPRRLALDSVRALILGELDREAEARAVIERLLAGKPTQVEAYSLIWAAAAHLPDPKLMVGSIEGMARTLGASDPTPVFEMLPPQLVYSLDRQLREKNLTAERVRLAEALIAMRWQRAEPAMLDSFRLYLIDRQLAEGRRGEAERLARQVVGPNAVLQLLIGKSYEGLLPRGDELLRLSLEEEDRGTASRLAAAPRDVEAILARIGYLRSVGKNEEAVAIAQPWLADVAATVAEAGRASWIVNDGAFALVALGRTDQALNAMGRLAGLDIAAHPESDLISSGINYGGLLWQVGRPQESLAYIARLRPLAAEHASDYGRTWIAGHAACANAALGRTAAAVAELRQMEVRPSVNAAALNMALLCMNDLDGSERLVIERLGSDDPAEMLVALQDFRLETSEGAALDAVRRRFDQVRSRPAVRAAIERAGRILSLPVDRTYYGTF